MQDNLAIALMGFPSQLLPEIILGLAACVLFLGATWKVSRHVWGTVALAALVLAGLAMWSVHHSHTPIENEPKAEFADTIRFSAPVLYTKFGVLFKLIGLITGVLLVLLGWDEGGEEHAGEYHACLLLIAAGIGLTGAANDLITLFLALELISIPTYIVLYLPRITAPAQEAAMKYFLLSVFSSGLLLFGFSYLYGVTGTTNISGILDSLGASQGGIATRAVPTWRGLVLVSLVMIVAGLGFRITAVPFHFYAPDVYQGTTTVSAGMLAFVPKIVGFAALLKLLGFVGDSNGQAMGSQAPILFWIMAAVTMTLGNILALWQTNIKRLLAYSSIAHAGYMLIGLAVAPRMTGTSADAVNGVEAVVFYLAAYGAMTLGSFAVLHVLSQSGKTVENEDDLVGLGKTHPVMALVMVLFLFSLIGMPLTAGFVGKFLLFFDAMSVFGSIPEGNAEAVRQATEQGRLYGLLALIGAVNAAIGAWYYLRLASAMYLREAIMPLPAVKTTPAVFAMVVCAVLTLVLGMFPSTLLSPIREAIRPTIAGQAKIAADGPKVAQR